MPDELVFNVQESRAVPATPISLPEAGLNERRHLQEWVLSHPEIIGDGVLVVTSEFRKLAISHPRPVRGGAAYGTRHRPVPGR